MWTQLILLLSLGMTLPQDSQENSEETGFRIGVAVDQVFLSVNARSVNGGFVGGLKKTDFLVYEDGVKQQIVNFYSQGVPVHVVLLIDISGSTREAQSEIRRAALGFAKSLAPEDKVAIVTFNYEPRLILNWTNDIARIETALESIYAKGTTVLHDALYVVFDDLLREARGKTAVIALTDGIDTESMVTQSDVMQLADRSETMVYVVSKLEEYWAGAIAARLRYQARAQLVPKQLTDDFILAAKRFLGRLAQQTGAKVLDARAFASLSDVYRQVAEELKNQYYISYVPSNIMKDGRWRTVDLRVGSIGVQVSTRPGYYAPLVPGQSELPTRP